MPKTRIMAFTWSTLKNLFSKPATKNYPAEPIRYLREAAGTSRLTSRTAFPAPCVQEAVRQVPLQSTARS